MNIGSVRRSLAAASVTVMAGGALVVGGAGAASAAPVEWADGNTKLTRTISNVSPDAGDVITVTTKFERTNSVDEYLYYMEDHHDACFSYVDGSARRNGSEDISQYVRVNSPTAVIVDRKAPGWRVSDLPLTRQSQTIALNYRVTEDCLRATPLNTGLVYSGTLGEGSYPSRGPAVTVAKNTSKTVLAPVTGAMVGQVSVVTATVTGAAPGDPVELYSGSTKVDDGTVGADGLATFEWMPTVRGSVALQAQFPESGRAKSSQSAVQTVSVAQANVDSVTTLAPVSGAEVGKGAPLTASVTPAGSGGTVTFKNGDLTLATVAVGSNSQATYVWNPQTAGDYTITVEFSGRDGVNASATSQAITVAERPAEVTESATTLESVAAFEVGSTSTLVARISPADAGGSVTFKDGTVVIGTADVGADGVARFEWKPTQPGQRTITAEYSGRGNVLGSSDAVSALVNAPEVPTPTDPTAPGGGSGSLGSLTGSLGS